MPYLPSELWLQILSCTNTTSPKDLWRSLRPVNRQLRDCVDQHFTDTILPTLKLELSFGLPCYDGRNPLRGKAIFTFSHFATETADGEGDRVMCNLVDVEPEHYMEQLLVRWNRLRESSCGSLPRSLEWSMCLEAADGSDGSGGKEGPVRLKEPVAFASREDGNGKAVEGGAVGFEWRGTVGSFFS